MFHPLLNILRRFNLPVLAALVIASALLCGGMQSVHAPSPHRAKATQRAVVEKPTKSVHACFKRATDDVSFAVTLPDGAAPVTRTSALAPPAPFVCAVTFPKNSRSPPSFADLT